MTCSPNRSASLRPIRASPAYPQPRPIVTACWWEEVLDPCLFCKPPGGVVNCPTSPNRIAARGFLGGTATSSPGEGEELTRPRIAMLAGAWKDDCTRSQRTSASQSDLEASERRAPVVGQENHHATQPGCAIREYCPNRSAWTTCDVTGFTPGVPECGQCPPLRQRVA